MNFIIQWMIHLPAPDSFKPQTSWWTSRGISNHTFSQYSKPNCSICPCVFVPSSPVLPPSLPDFLTSAPYPWYNVLNELLTRLKCTDAEGSGICSYITSFKHSDGNVEADYWDTFKARVDVNVVQMTRSRKRIKSVLILYLPKRNNERGRFIRIRAGTWRVNILTYIFRVTVLSMPLISCSIQKEIRLNSSERIWVTYQDIIRV